MLTWQQTWLQCPAHSIVIPSILLDEISLRDETMLKLQELLLPEKIKWGLQVVTEPAD